MNSQTDNATRTRWLKVSAELEVLVAAKLALSGRTPRKLSDRIAALEKQLLELQT